ncbi:MAG: antitoxin [Actinomycetota bacterium]|nr:antitoxin [Actinomycetota bacterium]
MRTTIAIADELLASAKAEARRRGLTLGEYVEQALRSQLAARSEGTPPAIPVRRGGSGLRPGVDASSYRTLLEAVEEGLPVEDLR